MSFSKMLNRKVTVKRRGDPTLNDLREPVYGDPTVVNTEVPCRVRLASAFSQQTWGEQIHVTHEGYFRPDEDLEEGDIIEDPDLGTMTVKKIMMDSSEQYKKAGMEA